MEILAFYGLQLTIALIISDCFFVFRFRLVHNMLHITEKSQLPRYPLEHLQTACFV